MRRKAFIVNAREDERSELLRKLAAALGQRPAEDEHASSAKRAALKSTDQE